MSFLIGVVLFVVLLVPVFLLDGYVFLRLWEWFVLPVFESAPTFNLLQAIGLSALIGFATTNRVQPSDDDKTQSEKMSAFFMRYYFSPIFTLIIGYIITLFL
jgi:Zn-dependent protease